MTPASAPRRRRQILGVLAAILVVALAGVAFALVAAPAEDRGPPPRSPSPERSRPPDDASDAPALDDLSRLPADRDDASRAAAEVPAFGMMAWRANQLGPADFALIRRGGARYYRFNLTTSSTDDRERRVGTGNFDRLIRAGVTQGIEFLPVLLRSRPSGAAGGPGQVAEPPETAREHEVWRDRVRLYAERYGPDGRFWRENPELPYRPVRAWEVWNEPNLRQFWDRREVDAREYGRLLVETRKVLRAVDPEARIVSAGLSSRYDGASYLATVLDEARPCSVDAIGIHPYAPTVEGTMDHLTDTRRAADRGGADGVPLWTTEIGWRAGGRGYTATPDARAQADRLRGFAAAAEQRRNKLELGPSFAFALRDRVDPRTGRVTSTHGLRRADDRPRPAWRVWSKAARGAPELALPPARRC